MLLSAASAFLTFAFLVELEAAGELEVAEEFELAGELEVAGEFEVAGELEVAGGSEVDGVLLQPAKTAVEPIVRRNTKMSPWILAEFVDFLFRRFAAL